MKAIFSSAAALLAVAVNAQSAPKCSESSKCPESAPCCSQYGQCGVGAYCLGGCDPKSSFSLQSCMAAPVCKSEDYKLTSLAGMEKNTVYLGDASKANWVTSGTAVEYNGDSVLLTMAPSTVGTLISSTHYVWYGKVSVTMTSSQGQGVVTAFILMSDVKDEIDFEFVGDDVSHAQSNYYYQGITDYGNMSPLDATNTRENVHTYTIDWTPDKVTWGIDGKEMRTLEKASTWNSSTGSYHFPQTPSRIQLSLWPAGLETNGEGTIEWAGGLVDWDGPYMQNGYYYAMVNEVNVECYDPPSDWTNTGSGNSAYYYTSTVGTNNTVAIGNNNTILASFMASGNNPNYDPNAKPSGSSSTASAPSMSATPESVPGISGGGNVASSGQAPTESDDGDSSSGSGTGSGSASESSGSSSGSSGFSQGGGSSGSGSGSGDSSAASKTFDGAAVALVGFFVAALML